MATKKEIGKFKKKYRKELKNCENHNLIEFLMSELQKVWGWRFQKNFFTSIARIQQIEQSILPEVVEIYKKHGLEIALQQFENLFSNIWRKDRRGFHRRKRFPRGNTLENEFKSEKEKLDDRLRKSYRNPLAKTLDLEELYPKIDKKSLEKWSQFSNRELALCILSYKYVCSPLTLRNELTKARKVSNQP